MNSEPFEKAVEGLAAEVPVEGLGSGVIAVLEGHEPRGERVEVGEQVDEVDGLEIVYEVAAGARLG